MSLTDRPQATAFAAVRADGSVVTWGDPGSGGDSASSFVWLGSRGGKFNP